MYLVRLFPKGQQAAARNRLARVCRALISQHLLRTTQGSECVAAMEILIMTDALRECITSPGRLAELPDLIARDRQRTGSQTLQQHMTELQAQGLVSPADVQNKTKELDITLPFEELVEEAAVAYRPGTAGTSTALNSPESVQPVGTSTAIQASENPPFTNAPGMESQFAFSGEAEQTQSEAQTQPLDESLSSPDLDTSAPDPAPQPLRDLPQAEPPAPEASRFSEPEFDIGEESSKLDVGTASQIRRPNNNFSFTTDELPRGFSRAESRTRHIRRPNMTGEHSALPDLESIPTEKTDEKKQQKSRSGGFFSRKKKKSA